MPGCMPPWAYCWHCWRANPTSPTQDRVVDVALYESMFNLMEGIVPEWAGDAPARSRLNHHRYRANQHLSLFRRQTRGDRRQRRLDLRVRLMTAIGRDDLANDLRLAGNPGRVTHQKLIDGAIAAWADKLTSAEVIQTMDAADVPVGVISLFSIADAFEDPQLNTGQRDVRAGGRAESGRTGLAIPAISPVIAEHRARSGPVAKSAAIRTNFYKPWA